MSGRHGKKRKRRKKKNNMPPPGAIHVQLGEEPAESEPENTIQTPVNSAEAIRMEFRKPDPFDVALYGLIVAVIVGIIYFRQLRSMQESVQLSRVAFETSSRAYVVPKECKIHPTKTAEGDAASGPGTFAEILPEKGIIKLTSAPVLEATLVNAGKTPASEVTLAARIEVRDDFKIPSTIESKTNLTKSVGIWAPDVPRSIGAAYALSDQERTAIRGGYKIFVIYGVAGYLDVFKKTRHTHFCCFYVQEIDGMGDCPTGNYYD